MSAKQLTLLDLPITVANHLLEKLELKELLTCRKVCQSLRTAVDKLGAHFTDLIVRLKKKVISIDLDRNTITYSSSSLGGTDVKCDHWRRKNKFIRGENYLNIAFNDLKILLKHASCLHIQTTLEDEKDDREHAVNSLVDVLKKEGNIHMETIALHHYEFERITHLDQWKTAKYFNFWDSLFDCSPIEYFLHFEEFHVGTKDFPIQNLIKIRDDLLQRCTFQKCTISVLKENFKPVEFARIFQPDYTGDDEFTLEYANENSKFGIKFGDFEYGNMWTFKIERC